MRRVNLILSGVLLVGLLWGNVGCSRAPAPEQPTGPIKVVAVETYMADIAQQVAGDRLHVVSLMPIGVDPHAYEPTPGDVALVAQADVLVVNGAGLEAFLEKLLQNTGGQRVVIEGAAGLTMREPAEGEPEEHHEEGDAGHHHEGDPHFWLDPVSVIHYVENIRDGLSQADPDGAALYAANAERYIAQLKELDGWIVAQVQAVPAERRLLVTNHESFGYYADRYGFQVVGAVIPSVSSGAAPSAQELASLIDHIRETHAPAIFLETGSNTALADQIARETGVKVVTDLYTHSITDAGGAAPDYLEMMRYNTHAIVEALKP